MLDDVALGGNMSRDTAASFLVSLAGDPKLKAELDAQLDSAPDPVGSFVQFAGRKGQTFTPQDLGAALSMKNELGDKELERVAGGLNPQPLPPRSLFDTWSWYGDMLASPLLRVGVSLRR
jgi:predicted ribosomally synthesized peptide with nif11-like leader